MEFITTTQLRTQSTQLVKQLHSGAKVALVHRSQVIGSIIPSSKTAKKINVSLFKEFLDTVKPEKLISQSTREKIYTNRLLQKYG